MPQVGLAITGAITAFKATAVGAWLTGTIGGKLLSSVALSALQAATVTKPRPAGLTTERKATGSTNPRGFPLGTCATEGDEVCPPMSHGKVGKVPNAYATFVIALSDVPGITLNKVWIDKELVTLSGATHPDYGQEVLGRFAGFLWVKFYDGTQAVADPMLLAKYGTYPERPWLADMKLTGVAYAIVTARFNPKLFRSEPQFRFETSSIPLYDPRKDTTVGGSGAHRWTNTATWEPSNNPKVMEYNILHGIEVTNVGTWGGAATAADLPLANWFTAMNECDVEITTLAGTVPQYRAGLEVRVNMTPADVIDTLNLTCTGQTAEIGGVFKTRVGGPGLPVLFITDHDIIISRAQDYDPFDQADRRPNYITANYLDPANAYEPRPAPALANAAWELEDGGRRETALELSACPYPAQVQRIIASYARDGRRARKYSGALPPDAAVLEPLDSVSVTLSVNGFVAKLFEVSQIEDGARSMIQLPSLREADPSDYNWSPASEVAISNPSSALSTPATQVVTGFAVNPLTLLDVNGAVRGYGIEILWSGTEQEGVRAIGYEVWLGPLKVKTGNTTDVASGRTEVTSGLIRQTGYAVRIIPVADWPTDWTAYLTVTTPGALISTGDLLVTGNYAGTLNSDPNTMDVTAWDSFGGPAPQLFNVASSHPGGGQTALIAVGPNDYKWSKPYPIDEAKNYRAEIAASNGVGTSGCFLLVAFQDGDGTNITAGATGWPAIGSFPYFGLINQVPPSTFTRYAISFGPLEAAKIPTGARTARIGYLANFSGAAGDTKLFTAIRCVEQVQRSVLDPDSLQDVYRAVNPTRYLRSSTPTNFILASLSVPAMPDGTILKRAAKFETRRPGSYTSGPSDPKMELQGRVREFGGAFEPWRTLETWLGPNLVEEGAGLGAWQSKKDTGNLVGPHDEFQYQLILTQDASILSNANTWIGAANITLGRTTKGDA
jgi:Putative phage tail protein